MTVVKRRRLENFGIVPNHIWDERSWIDEAGEEHSLSFEAKGLLAYLLGRPNNWRVEISHLRTVLGCGRDKAYALVNELLAAGYATREQPRDPQSGKMLDSEVTIFDEPVPAIGAMHDADFTGSGKSGSGGGKPPEIATSGKSGSGSPVPGLPDTVNPEVEEEKEYNKKPPDPPFAADRSIGTVDDDVEGGCGQPPAEPQTSRRRRDRQAGENGQGARSAPAASAVPPLRHVHAVNDPELWRACCEAAGHRLSLIDARGGWSFGAALVTASRQRLAAPGDGRT